jgi:hypothetical protein
MNIPRDSVEKRSCYDKAIQLVLDQAETFADGWSK